MRTMLLPILVCSTVPSSVCALAPNDTLEGEQLASLRAAYETSRHAVRTRDDGLRAYNPAQRWCTTFDGRGFETRPRAGDWSWGLDLVAWGRAGDERDLQRAPEVESEAGTVRYAWDADLTEWWINDGRGLEHGYTLARRPGIGDEPLSFVLDVRGDLEPSVSSDARSVSFRTATGASTVTYTGLVAFDASGCRLAAGFQVVGDALHLTVDDRGARYPLTIDPIAQQAYLKSSNPDTGDFFGEAIAISGDTVVVGATGEDGSAPGVNGDDSLDDAPDAGAAYVFVRNGSTWAQEAYLKAANPQAGDWFGDEVDVSGDTIVVGSWREDSDATGVNGDDLNDLAADSGAAWVFERVGTTWTQQAYLKASNSEAGDRFGTAVAIDGDRIVVGAPEEDSSASGVDGNQASNGSANSGAVYVFERVGSTWTQQSYLKASNTDGNDRFGEACDVDDATVVVGARSERSNATGVGGDQANDSLFAAGAVYVFVELGTSFAQQAYVKASNTEAQDTFGTAVAIDGDTLVVGAPGEDSADTGVGANQLDNAASNAGAAYVFLRTGTNWAQQAYLKPSNSGVNDAYGRFLALSGDDLVVSSHHDDSLATGFDGSQGDSGNIETGAVFLYRRTGTVWTQQHYVKASNTEAFDQFGQSVDLDGTTLVVGANGEDGDDPGVNGDQSINAAFASGAAYVFEFGITASSTFRNAGSNPVSYSAAPPILGSTWNATVGLTTTGHTFALVFGYADEVSVPLGGGQTLLAFGGPELFGFAPAPGPFAFFALPLPPDPSLCGFTLATQAVHFGGVVPFALSNAQDLVVGN